MSFVQTQPVSCCSFCGTTNVGHLLPVAAFNLPINPSSMRRPARAWSVALDGKPTAAQFLSPAESLRRHVGLALKGNRQCNGSDGHKESRCNKTAWLQRNGQSQQYCHDIKDNFARPHPHSPLCDSKREARALSWRTARGPAPLGSLIASE